jgi:hypothetical protein
MDAPLLLLRCKHTSWITVSPGSHEPARFHTNNLEADNSAVVVNNSTAILRNHQSVMPKSQMKGILILFLVRPLLARCR